MKPTKFLFFFLLAVVIAPNIANANDFSMGIIEGALALGGPFLILVITPLMIIGIKTIKKIRRDNRESEEKFQS